MKQNGKKRNTFSHHICSSADAFSGEEMEDMEKTHELAREAVKLGCYHSVLIWWAIWLGFGDLVVA